MAGRKVSDLTSASSLTGDELVYVSQGGADRKTTVQAVGNVASTSGIAAHVAASDPHADRAYTNAQLAATANLTPAASYDDVPGITNAAINAQAQALANRTALMAPLIANVAALRALAAGFGAKAINLVGYYSTSIDDAPDGGGGLFVLDTSDTTTADNGGTVLVDAAGRRWKRPATGFVTVDQFGAKGDGTTNDYTAFDAAANSGNKTIHLLDKSYALASTVFCPVGVRFIGHGRTTKIVPKSGGTFTGGYVFIMNSTDGSTWVQPFPNMNSGGFERVAFDNPNGIAAIRGIRAFGSYEFRQMRFSGFRQSIQRPTGYYSDSFLLEHIICEDPQDNTEYQIEALGLGDGFVATDVHCPYTTATSSSVLAMRLRGTNGGVISACIGGDYLFEQCEAVSVIGGHFERAQHIADASSITFDNTNFYPDTRVPLIGRSTYLSSQTERYTLSLRDTKFCWVEGLMEYDSHEIQIDAAVSVRIDSSYRKWTASGALQFSQLSGIRVKDDSGNAIASFNDLSYLLSKRGRIGSNLRAEIDCMVNPTSVTFPGLTSTGAGLQTVTDQATQWTIATGTYYYKAQIIYDKTRLIGRNQTSAEYSLAVSGTDKMVKLVCDFSTKPRNCILRLYRGTTAGSYDKYVDIHNIGGAYFYDNGSEVNGHTWISRTAGATDTISSFGNVLEFRGENVLFRATALPTVGTWTQGDDLLRVDSAIDANNMLLYGHRRLTTGSGHSSGTDWAQLRTSHVSPAT